MAFTNAWVETDPDGSVITVSQLDNSDRLIKNAVRERLEGDPATPDLTGLIEVGSFAAAPKPRKGTARAYVDTQANILAFGATKREDGRLAVASDTGRLFHVATAAVASVKVDAPDILAGVLGTGAYTITPAVGSKGLVVASATQTTSQPVLDLSQTWNAGAVAFIAINLNIVDTASSAASKLFQLQVGGLAKFSVDKTGIVNTAGAMTVGGVSGGYAFNISAGATGDWGSSYPAIATSATSGFCMIPSCAGAPTGVPTNYAAGHLPMVYDTTNNKLWVYSGAWRGVVLA